tara:strand:- start:44 stop:580 length:537 start_codon:yes stop_codon:yes gene_type:complete
MSGKVNSTGASSGVVGKSVLPSGVTGGSGLSHTPPYADFMDVKTATTDGGTFTQDAWRTRDINTSIISMSGASLSSNQMTLPAGTYLCNGFAEARAIETHSARVYDTTNTATLVAGSHHYIGDSLTSKSIMQGKFTLSGTAALEVQHFCSGTKATFGFGGQVAWQVGVFTRITFLKVG